MRGLAGVAMADKPPSVTAADVDNIIRWAKGHSSILEVWLFGSVMTGAKAPCDVDVAIVLNAGGDAPGLFIVKHPDWQKELSALLPLPADLHATQTDHPSYPELLSGAGKYPCAFRVWSRVDDQTLYPPSALMR